MTFKAIAGLLYNGAPVGYDDGAVVTLPAVQPPVVVVPPVVVAEPIPADFNGLRIYPENVPWSIPNQINRHISNVIDSTSCWIAQFTPNANSVRAGRIQVVDAFSQDTFRDYIVFRASDGVVLQRQEGITATFYYWVGPNNPDPTGTFMIPFEYGMNYKIGVKNRPDVTIAGQVGLDIYQ